MTPLPNAPGLNRPAHLATPSPACSPDRGTPIREVESLNQKLMIGEEQLKWSDNKRLDDGRVGKDIRLERALVGQSCDRQLNRIDDRRRAENLDRGNAPHLRAVVRVRLPRIRATRVRWSGHGGHGRTSDGRRQKYGYQ